MTVPDFQSLMLPLLRLIGDEKEHNNSEVLESLAEQFHLTEPERKELLPSGRQARFDNRVAWARAYLKMAGLLENIRRGTFRITERGNRVLLQDPPKIDMKFLSQFPEYAAFRSRSQQSNKHEEPVEGANPTPETPDEILEATCLNIERELAEKLKEKIKGCSPKFFERLVVDLLIAMGYGGPMNDAGQVVSQSGDGGIDGIIKEDKLGLDSVYIQAKRWDGTVGRPRVQEFAGSLMARSARKGVFITTSQFSKEAIDYVSTIQQPKIVLVDGELLAKLMIDHGIGVADVATYTVKKVDLDYFEDE